MEILEKHNHWFRANVHAWWHGYQNLPYINEPFNDPASIERWKTLGYTQTKFTGDMYDMRQPQPDWIEPFKTHLPWDYFSWSIYRMEPGTVLPEHRDTYAKFSKINSIQDTDLIWRAIVFLEDWQSGHYFELDTYPIINWRCGDIVAWKSHTPHLAANVGTTMRYTLQITGIPHAY